MGWALTARVVYMLTIAIAAIRTLTAGKEVDPHFVDPFQIASMTVACTNCGTMDLIINATVSRAPPIQPNPATRLPCAQFYLQSISPLRYSRFLKRVLKQNATDCFPFAFTKRIEPLRQRYHLRCNFTCVLLLGQ